VIPLISSARDAVRAGVARLPGPARSVARAVLHCIKLPIRLLYRLAQRLGGGAAVIRHLDAASLRRRSPADIVRAVGRRIARTAIRAIDSLSYRLLHRVAVPLGAARTEKRLAAGRLRSLWGVTPILTLPLKVRADRLLGIRAQSLVFVTYHITKNFDFNLQKFVEKLYRHAPTLGPAFGRLLLGWALWRYDVFHYFYDRGLMLPVTRFGVNPEELEALRRSGKRVYLYAYGADVRRRNVTLGFGKWNFCKECPEPLKFCVCDDENGAPIMAAMSQAVTQPIALGDMLAYVPGARNMHYWPIDLAAIPAASSPPADGPLRIAHAPNHTHFKGSAHLEAIIAKLQAAGHAIEYVKVHGVPNAEVLRLFATVDIVADQFIGGAYGYTALEAMACGKPVLTYVRAPDMVEAVAECPLINVTPDTLEETLTWCLGNRGKLAAVGSQGRRYIERWHSIEAVADRFASLYLDTADFPAAVAERLAAYRAERQAETDRLPVTRGWEHPFRIGLEAPLRQWAFIDPGEQPGRSSDADVPRDAWHSYDRTPWNHPWLNPDHIRRFSAFSDDAMRRLRERLAERPLHLNSYAFCGNIANISYMRAAGLRRRGIDLTVYLPAHDPNLMSQPAWEDFDGEIGELGPDPQQALLDRPLPPGVCRMTVNEDWPAQLARGEAGFLDPNHVRNWPGHMLHIDGVRDLARHDALLVTQLLYFGPLANRPFIVGQMGGEIWFDAARDDALGRLTRLALQQAYAVLVSNPLTLSHARRYGLTNCLYLPLMLDEERYKPGDASDIRAQWQAQSGGEFFVLTSMRLDNGWKGAHLALEGFAEFARTHPGARLIALGWGADEAAAREQLARSGIADQVLLMPIVGKARLARYLQAADVLIEQFVLGYYGASALEAMASGLPVIMRLERAQYDALIPAGAPPVLEAESAADVAAHLSSLYREPDRRKALGTGMRDWFMATHSSERNWHDMMVLLDAAALGLKIDWEASPLNSPLAASEETYHRDQLKNAPPFGTYQI
jgi:glycosyltransferase involved in cell wall biosynthesis